MLCEPPLRASSTFEVGNLSITMANTNYTITGSNFFLKTESGLTLQDAPVALVQWELGYDPKYRPIQEWTSNPILVSWTGWYQRDYPGVGVGVFGSNGTVTGTAGPLYAFIDFGNSSSATPEMYGQVWMGQITDILTLPGGDVVIDLNSANIQSVVGSRVGNTLVSSDWNTWQPVAVPEPSYSAFAVVLFAVALIAKKVKQCTK
jgi:hypothetical protein